MNSETPLPRYDNDFVLTKFHYGKNNVGSIHHISFTMENADRIDSYSFGVMKPGEHQGANYIMNVESLVLCDMKTGDLMECSNRMSLRHCRRENIIMCYNDQRVGMYELFCKNCGALSVGCGLKEYTYTTIKKDLHPTA